MTVGGSLNKYDNDAIEVVGGRIPYKQQMDIMQPNKQREKEAGKHLRTETPGLFQYPEHLIECRFQRSLRLAKVVSCLFNVFAARNVCPSVAIRMSLANSKIDRCCLLYSDTFIACRRLNISRAYM